MADEKKAAETETPTAKKATRSKSEAPVEKPEAKPAKKSDAPKAPRRPTLNPEMRRLLSLRGEITDRRPKFVRTASHRYFRIGRWESWRAPKGLQSKQRRHYGYRPVVVSIGYGSPARTRGLTPTGFQPVIVHTTKDIEALEAHRQAAIIARTVGTRRRLVLEETCRKLGIHILNPIVKDREAT
jgi:large subunit ribosomal protein L32e